MQSHGNVECGGGGRPANRATKPANKHKVCVVANLHTKTITRRPNPYVSKYGTWMGTDARGLAAVGLGALT